MPLKLASLNFFNYLNKDIDFGPSFSHPVWLSL